MKKLLLVDGHAMAYRAHYALINQNMTDASGMPTETIFGFFRMLVKILSDKRPDYFIIFFDPPRPTFRHEMFSEYKANRKETPDSLRVQLEEIKDIVKNMNLPFFVPEKEEADDAIASIIEREKESDIQIYILSSDKDLFNMLYSNVKMLRAKKGVSEFIEIDADYVYENVGVKRERIPDYMALTGDTSDNIPGVKGIGEKTASKLIQEFDSLDGIYLNLDKISSASQREKLETGKENAYFSKKLVTLKKDIKDLPSLDSLLWLNKKEIIEKIPIFREKGHNILYNEWAQLFENSQDGKPRLSKEKIAENYILIRNEKEWETIREKFMGAGEISIDTETNSISPVEAKLVGVSFSVKEKDNYVSAYVPVVFDEEGERHFDYQNIFDSQKALSMVKPVFENKKSKKIGQNIKYDWIVLENHGVNLQNVFFDTMVGSYLLNPGVRMHGLDDLSFNYLGHETIKYKDMTGTGKKQKALVSLPLEELAHYAAEDAEVALRVKEQIFENLEKENLIKLYNEIDGPLIEVLKTMEQNGVLIDLKYLKSLESDYEKKAKALEEKIHELADEEFNIQSTKELQRILFDKLEIQSKKKTQKGQLSTSAQTLDLLKGEHPIIEVLLDYRGVTKLLSTYVSALPKYVNSKTNRVHTSFSQTITATGRLASSDPNLQNIPVKEEDGRAIRKSFVPAEKYEFLSFDYSQIELRVLAHYSNDENLVRAYNEDMDIHDQAAYLLFRNKFDEKSGRWIEGSSNQIYYGDIDNGILEMMKGASDFKKYRGKAKILNFSIVYGVTEFGLSKSMGIEREEARNLIELYFEAYPSIKKFMTSVIEETKEKGYSENYFGRKRRIAELENKNRFAREAAERLAVNNPIQSTAADIIKLAMINIQKEISEKKMKTKMLLQIHDELLFEIPEEEKEEAFEMIKNKMENVVKLKVPLKVNGGFGKNWEESK
ncbi:MAG: DNA polymerase I [Spirochaetia bacterium]|nr:DNA polymerase I [Spirochaetia bacterium]